MSTDQLVTDQRGFDLAGRVRPAHVRVVVVDPRDPPTQHLLEGLAGPLGFRELRHSLSLVCALHPGRV